MYQLFLEIARELNEIGIIPLLMGSVGLERVTNRSWEARDLDIHVPSDPRGWEAPDEGRIYQFSGINALMEKLGFQLVDRHEHEFQKSGLSVEFGGINSLPSFAGIPLEELEEHVDQGVRYFLPTAEQYLKIYRISSEDSYRADKNNQKDFAKIAYLENILNS
ncbi:phosphoribosylanthranilate isomerase [Streptococcus merionis]|uniref:phosphoribosylanthranilate isomerase n=1 Tax=Streptococcus merionis TaxID=400065 RepID=UPI003516065C